MSRKNPKNRFTEEDASFIKGIVVDAITTLIPPMFDAFEIRFEAKIDDKIEDLARKTKRGFDDIHERMVTKEEFEPFKKQTEQSFYYLQTDVTDLKTRMTRVENRLDGVEGRLDGVEICMRVMSDRFDGVESCIKDHDTRIVHLERTFA